MRCGLPNRRLDDLRIKICRDGLSMSMVLRWLNSAGYFPTRFTIKRRLQQEEWHLEGEVYALRNDWTVFNEHVF